MAVTIAEPNDISSGSITPETENFYEILVYQKAADNAGIKRMAIAGWKNYLNFNSHKVNNLERFISVDDGYAWDTDADVPYSGVPITERIQGLADKIGVTAEPGAGFPTILPRLEQLEDYVKDGWDDESSGTTVHVEGLLDRTTNCESHIEELEDAIGGGATPGPGTLTGRIDALENTVGDNDSGLVKDVTTLKDEVENSTTGLIKKVTDNTTDISTLKTTVGNNSSGLVKDVNDINTKLGSGTTTTLISDVTTLKEDVETPTTGLKDVVGDSESGLVKDVNDAKTTLYGNGGTPDVPAQDSMVNDVEIIKEALNGRFNFFKNLNAWSSEHMTGVYLISYYDIGGSPTNRKYCSFIVYLNDGIPMPFGSNLGIDYLTSESNFNECFETDSQGYLKTKKSILKVVNSIKIGEVA